jgi:hypothetical protein
MKSQALYAYKLIFRCGSEGLFGYLDGRVFEAENVWLRDAFLNGGFHRKDGVK